jgi:hypothetical protein
MAKRITKKLTIARAFFQRNVCEFVESIGAVAKPCDFAREYILQTSIDQVEITVFENWIACQFADLCAAAVFTERNGPRTNLHSGKWNFIYSDEPDVLNNGLVIGDFVSAIERLLAYVPTPEDVAKTNSLRAKHPRAARVVAFGEGQHGSTQGNLSR